jgi:hypothetical protein
VYQQSQANIQLKQEEKVMSNTEQERQAKVNTKQANKPGIVNKNTSTHPKEILDETLVDYVKFNRELDDKLSDKTKTAAELADIESTSNSEKLNLHQEFNTKFSKIIDNLDWRK